MNKCMDLWDKWVGEWINWFMAGRKTNAHVDIWKSKGVEENRGRERWTKGSINSLFSYASPVSCRNENH